PPSGSSTSPLPCSLEISMPQRAHSTRSSGSGTGADTRAAHPIATALARISRIPHRIVMVVSPHVTFEQALITPQLEGSGRVGLDAAVPQQHDSCRQMTDVGRHMRREEERPPAACELPRTVK